MTYLVDTLGEQPWYCTFRALPYIEALVSLSALTAGFLAYMWKKRIVLLIIIPAVLFIYVCVPFIKTIALPLNLDVLSSERWSEDVCLQSSGSTCGPASLATIMRSMGLERKEREIAKAAYTGSTGTENWYLARYAKAQGLKPKFLNCQSINDVPVHSIVGVKLGNNIGHFITLLPSDTDKLVIGEPLAGRLELTINEFNEKYRFTGFVLTFN